MIPCECCKKNAATIHLTDIRGDVKREIHLCAACAKAKGFTASAAMQLPQLLGAIAQPGKAARRAPRRADNPACPNCGLTWSAFRESGRLGCPEDYNVFRARLSKLIAQYHEDTRHVGERPHGAPEAADDDENDPAAGDLGASDPSEATGAPAVSEGSEMSASLTVDGAPSGDLAKLIAHFVEKQATGPDAAGGENDWLKAIEPQAREWGKLIEQLVGAQNPPADGPGMQLFQVAKAFLEKKARELTEAAAKAEAGTDGQKTGGEKTDDGKTAVEKVSGEITFEIKPGKTAAQSEAETIALAAGNPADLAAAAALRRKSLERRLERAVREERYEDAANLRDRIRAMDETSPLPLPPAG